MDPQAAWERLVRALNEAHDPDAYSENLDPIDEGISAAVDLIQWLEAGGFMPPEIAPEELVAVLKAARDRLLILDQARPRPLD